MSVLRPVSMVPLWHRGKVVGMAFVDIEDSERVNVHRWRPHVKGYAYARIDRRTVLLHRFVMGLERGDGRECDHENRNKRDCTRANLRVVTRAQNAQNRPAHRGSTSRFRGVGRWRDGWQVQIQVAGRRVKVGYRRDEVEAALLAHEARSRLMPFALPDPELVKLGLV